MTHLSGGAISGIIFGTMLFVFVSVSLMLWWRRVHLDHYSTAPDAWGGSWGAKAQRELQERINKQRAAQWAAEEEERERAQTVELSRREAWHDGQVHAAANGDEAPPYSEANAGPRLSGNDATRDGEMHSLVLEQQSKEREAIARGKVPEDQPAGMHDVGIQDLSPSGSHTVEFPSVATEASKKAEEV